MTGVDSSAVALEKARTLAEQQGADIQIVVCDLADFDLGVARWDGIISIGCHLPRGRCARGFIALSWWR